jgi:sialate O-acetylesterase
MFLRLLLCVLLIPVFSHAQPVLPAFFSDNMVLQQQSNVAIWGKAKAGDRIEIITSWNRKKYTAQTGSDGKWKTSVSTPAAGGPYEIRISNGKPRILHNVLIGEVWLCSGQSNMEMPMKGYRDQPILGGNDAVFNSANDQIRLFTVPRSIKLQLQDTVKSSAWQSANSESVANFSATAYYFGRILQQRLKIPIGLVHISYGGSNAEAWMNENSLKEFPEIKIAPLSDSAKVNNRSATTLYNGMVGPFLGYGIRGVIWYQGESNQDRPDQYEKLFPAMVKFWREQAGQGDFPFYYVQIAPYNYGLAASNNSGGKYNSAYLRDAQRKALRKIPNSGMAVVMDIGEETSIHPANKEAGGKRLAYLALNKTYGQKGFGYTSPMYDSMTIAGNIATIKFTDVPNGLTSFGKPLTQFEIAGADKYWRPAKATISRGTILVSSPDVKEPVAVRYAFKDFIIGELYSTEGFPVSSFRTDEW